MTLSLCPVSDPLSCLCSHLFSLSFVLSWFITHLSPHLQIMDMEGWVLLGADRQEVPVAVYPGQDLVEADLSDVPDVYQDLHWHAPKTYLGDKVTEHRRKSKYIQFS